MNTANQTKLCGLENNALLGCKEKIRREKEVRERLGREKNERNRVDLMYGLV
jgi:hypothetical protein